jgi:predicted ATPase
MEVKKLFIKDVRCFEGETEFNIRPLTFLVGENSTGKTTTLGCMQALRYGIEMWRFLGVRQAREDVFDGFNIPPYEMGTFADIARKKAPTRQFVLRFGIQLGSLVYTHSLIFGENSKGIFISGKELKFDDGKIIVKNVAKMQDIKIGVNGSKNSFTIKANAMDFAFLGQDIGFLIHLLESKRMLLTEKTEKKAHPAKNGIKADLIKYLKSKIKSSETPSFGDIVPFYSIAPIRSKPKRTYDPISTRATSEGDEIPILLMKMSRNDKARWNALRKWLNKFGKASSMFDDIEVKTFSPLPNTPFQLRFTVRGTKANMADIGYGVSQVLPILVSVFTKDNATFLMQQPEVHLHPKAQAELLSFLATDIKTRKNRYVLETHSDYMLDRARIEIMKGNIDPEDVSLIYLEPTGNKVVTHNITFDKQGNFIGTPKGYRSFFDKEVDGLLGF